jgi:hypothetical protein
MRRAARRCRSRPVYGINFTPFIEEAERRAEAAKV